MQKHFKAAFAFSSLLFMSMPLISQEVTCIHPVQCQTYETSLKKEDFVSVSLTDKDNGWIMSHSGSLFRYKDGALIRDQKIGLNHASCVAVADQNLAWAIADFTLFRYDGTQWKKEDLGFATSQLIKIHVVDAQHAYALGFHGTLLKYDNGVWSKIQLPEPYADQFLFNASFIDAHTGWIIAESAILKYKDGA
ncbi:MAG TPA: hypothetical protein VL947_13080, partial [Cytophagales bacterium]|nr:hypothetical protein [Cytophagales bacterium]